MTDTNQFITDFYKGDTVRVTIQLPEQDLSGKNLIVTFKRKQNDPDILAYLQKVFVIPSDEHASLGIFEFSLSSEETILIQSGRVYYDIRLRKNTVPPIVATIDSQRIQVFENISDLGDPTWVPPASVAPYFVTLLNNELGSADWQLYRTPNQILADLLSVDGAGSGLDADLLDGFDSTYFAPQATTYSISEVDTLIQNLVTNIDWKESVATFADLATTYPTAIEGWTVSVSDEDAIYRFDGTSWVIIANGNVPLATTVLDGKLSSIDFSRIQDIAATLDTELGQTDWRSGGYDVFSDANFTVQNVGDITKQLMVDVGSVTTSTTRTITAPDFDLNLNYINPEFLTNGLLFGINSGGGALGRNDSIIIGNNSANTKLQNNNIIIGHNAGAKTNSANIILGNYAGLQSNATATDGSYNVFAGNRAGSTLLNSQHSIFIGNYAGYGAETSYNSVMIGSNTGYNSPRYLYHTTWIGVDVGTLGGEDLSENVILTDGIGRLSYRDDNTLGTTTIYNELIARTPTFQDSTDNTKELHWNLSQISTLSSRTITAPDFDLNLNYINPEFLTNGLLFGINSGGGNSGFEGGNNSIIIGNNSANSLLYNDNIIIGHNAGAMSNIGNVILGNYAGFSASEEEGGGSYNVFAGDHAGSTLLESENSIFIGDYAGYGVEYSYRSIMIGSNNEGNATGYLGYTTWIGADAGIFTKEALIENVILTDGAGRLSYRDDNTLGTTTIYNKLIARTPTFQNSKDNTKELSWDLSSISTLSSRTITAPDFDFDFNDWFLGSNLCSQGGQLYLSSSGDNGTKIRISGASDIRLYNGSIHRYTFTHTSLDLPSSHNINFSSSNDPTAVKDTGLARHAPGVVKVTDGSTGTGRLKSVSNIKAKVTKSANYTIDITTDYYIRVDTAAVTITLPDATTCEDQEFLIKNLAGGNITVDTTSSQVFDGVDLTKTVIDKGALKVVSNGADWDVIQE